MVLGAWIPVQYILLLCPIAAAGAYLGTLKAKISTSDLPQAAIPGVDYTSSNYDPAVINTAAGVDPHYFARVLEEPLMRVDADGGVDSDDDATAAALKKAGKVVGKVGNRRIQSVLIGLSLLGSRPFRNWKGALWHLKLRHQGHLSL